MTLKEWKKRCEARDTLIHDCLGAFDEEDISVDAKAIMSGTLVGSMFIAESIELALVEKNAELALVGKEADDG